MDDNFDVVKSFYLARLNDVFSSHSDLVLGDIHEHSIYDDFFELGFGTRYRKSGRKSKFPIFLRDDFQRTVVKDYFNGLSKAERKNKIRELYNYLSRKDIF
jgi:hypothetical protein